MKPTFLTPLILASLISLPSTGATTPDLTTTAASHSASLAATTGAPENDPVVAKGNGFEIRRSAMDQVLATAKAKDPQDELPPEAEVQVINQLIELQLVLQKATESEKAVGMKNADTTIANIQKNISPTEFQHRLQATLMTEADLHRMLYEEATAQQSLTRQLRIIVTDADAKKFFDANPGAYDQPVIVRIRELLLLTTSDFSTSAAPPLPAATIQAKRKLMDDLLKRIRAGEDFAALAKQYNEDPISKDTGGEISYKKDQMEFGDQAMAMKPNQISDVLTSEEGFRIFQLLEVVPAKKAEFADLDSSIKSMLAGKEKRMRAPAYINQLRQDANVQIVDPVLKEKVDAAIAAVAAQAASSTSPAKL